MRPADKIPHQPERLVGLWAVSMGHELFKITSAGMEGGDPRMPYFVGVGLRGQSVRTSTPTVLTLSDQVKLEEHHALEAES